MNLQVFNLGGNYSIYRDGGAEEGLHISPNLLQK